MKKSNQELLNILDYVFEHYIDADITDETREEVKSGYKQIKGMIEQADKTGVSAKCD
ncbi:MULTISPECIES: hypothetical protein [unclassified Bacillus cereus group]|uniref:hypothetical protein n=1 Tax=unclassified Bacillus cereus group TaxID=2750818 RepID=UPI001F566128|nr:MULTISPECIES: hypothetical protein [unclassified Bacillus cereus group]